MPTNANQVGGTEGVQNFVRATGQTITVSADVAAPPTIKRMPVRVATTVMLNQYPVAPYPSVVMAPSGLQTIDGVALVEGDRVLVKDNGEINGIYVASTGFWSFAQDSLTPLQQVNTSMYVQSGTENGGQYFWEKSTLQENGDVPIYVEIADPATIPSYLYLAGAASNGNQLSQDITLNFTDVTCPP